MERKRGCARRRRKGPRRHYPFIGPLEVEGSRERKKCLGCGKPLPRKCAGKKGLCAQGLLITVGTVGIQPEGERGISSQGFLKASSCDVFCGKSNETEEWIIRKGLSFQGQCFRKDLILEDTSRNHQGVSAGKCLSFVRFPRGVQFFFDKIKVSLFFLSPTGACNPEVCQRQGAECGLSYVRTASRTPPPAGCRPSYINI